MANKITKETIEKIAHLAHLKLSDPAALVEDLSAIVSWMELLNEVDVSDVAPLAHPMEIAPTMRADKPDAPLPQDEALGSAPESQGGFFVVPKTNE